MEQVTVFRSTYSESKVIIDCKTDNSNTVVYSASDPLTLCEAILDLGIGNCFALDLDQFVAPIIKLLGMNIAESLYHKNRVTFRPFNLSYVHGKKFQIIDIRSQGKRVSIYDLSQYFPKEDTSNLPLEIASDRALQVVKAVKGLNLPSRNFSSPVKLFEESYLSRMSLPVLSDIPDEVIGLSSKCAGKLWIQAYKLGYFENIKDYDMKGAFPNIMKDLIDIRRGYWTKVKDFADPLMKKAYYGYFKGKITIKDNAVIHPIMKNRNPNSKNTEDKSWYSPVGTWNDILTLEEILFIQRWRLGTFEPFSGWVFIPDKIIRPFRNTISNMLLKWKESSDPVVKTIAKRMSVGIYGKMLEKYEDRLGKYYNPVYGAEITSRCRLECANFIYRNKLINDLIHIYVDGVAYQDNDSKITKLEAYSNDIQWQFEYEGKMLVLSSGLIYSADKKPKGLHLNEIIDLFEKNPKKGIYSVTKQRPITLKEAVQMNDLSKVGLVSDFKTEIDFYSMEHDRNFKPVPMCGKDIMRKTAHSKPFKASQAI